MKPAYYIILLLVAGVFVQDIRSQTQPPRTRLRPSQAAVVAEDQSLPKLTPRAEVANQAQKKDLANVVWLREVYRDVDLKKADNAALYYPTQPINNRMNFFTLVFKLFAQNKIKAYDYIGEREIFTDKYQTKFRAVLDRYKIPFTSRVVGADTLYTVDERDIPSSEVTEYTIKEAWYFDQATGTYDSEILAVSPKLVRDDDYGISKEPLFWLPYENIRPYLTQMKIMTSDLNNAMTYTMDDYFRKRMYKGDIIKTTNMLNQSLAAQVGSTDPKVLKHAQDSIENQLKAFEKQLWVPVDSTQVTTKKGKETTKATTGKKSKEEKPKESKPKESKPEKTESAPTKSVRRTR